MITKEQLEDNKRMIEETDKKLNPFGRQRELVEILLIGDHRDLDYYSVLIKRAIEARSFDSVDYIARGVSSSTEPSQWKLRIYPAANND